jgi:hypothetical protein
MNTFKIKANSNMESIFMTCDKWNCPTSWVFIWFVFNAGPVVGVLDIAGFLFFAHSSVNLVIILQNLEPLAFILIFSCDFMEGDSSHLDS